MAILDRNRTSEKPRVPRKDRRGASPFAVGAAVLLVAVALTYLGFTKHIPFTHGFRVKAVVENANSIRKNSPVRIAGVNIGKVKKIEGEPGTHTAIITMEIDKDGLPIHKDATLKIRPRIFLEGNFFVDLRPGTPSAPTLGDGDGDTIPVAQTSSPVQFGDVLTALQADDRKNLQDLLAGFGRALTRKPTAADDATADPATRGKTAAQALNRAAGYGGPAFRNAAIVNDAFLGQDPHDLSALIRGLSKVTGGLGRDARTLQDFVTNFNATMSVLASEQANLRSTIRLLGPTVSVAYKTLGELDAAFPQTRAFARDILPGVRETPATIKASFPWIAQTRALLRPSELQGLARELSPATRDLSKTIDTTIQLLPQQSLIAKCLTNVILPTGDIKINDGPLSTGTENYKEFWYTMVGLSGESQNFDGNGQMVRFQPGGSGGQSFSTGASSASGDVLFGRDPNGPIGTRPAYPGKRPPYRPDVPCHTQKLPDLNGATTGPADGSSTVTARSTSGSGAGAGGGTGASGGGTGLTVPPVLGAKRRAAPRVAADSVAAQLLDRLNPWRAPAPAKHAKAGKGHGR